MQKADFFLSLVLIAFGLIMAIWVIPGQALPSEQYGMSPAALPMICAIGIVILSFILLMKNLPRKWNREKCQAVISRVALGRTGRNLAIALASLLIMGLMGYLAAGAFLIIASMLSTGNRSPLRIVLCALIAPTALFVIMRYALSVNLP